MFALLSVGNNQQFLSRIELSFGWGPSADFRRQDRDQSQLAGFLRGTKMAGSQPVASRVAGAFGRADGGRVDGKIAGTRPALAKTPCSSSNSSSNRSSSNSSSNSSSSGSSSSRLCTKSQLVGGIWPLTRSQMPGHGLACSKITGKRTRTQRTVRPLMPGSRLLVRSSDGTRKRQPMRNWRIYTSGVLLGLAKTMRDKMFGLSSRLNDRSRLPEGWEQVQLWQSPAFSKAGDWPSVLQAR